MHWGEWMDELGAKKQKTTLELAEEALDRALANLSLAQTMVEGAHERLLMVRAHAKWKKEGLNYVWPDVG